MADIELRHLRYFVAVAEELNFTRAAERLQMAQPPLSRQIQRLEKELGVELLQRTQRRVELTAAGQIFLSECYQILSQIDVSILTTQRAARGEIGRLVIGFEGSFNYEVVPLAIQAFHSQFPNVGVTLQEMSSGDQVEALRGDRIELGFIVPPIPTEGFEIEVLLAEPLMAAIAATHPLVNYEQLALSQLADEPWITGSSESHCGLLAQILNVCDQTGFIPAIRQETNEIQMALGFVAAGLGVTLLPASSRQFRRTGVAYRPLNPPVPEIELAMAWPSHRDSPVVGAFVKTVRELLADSLLDETSPDQI